MEKSELEILVEELMDAGLEFDLAIKVACSMLYPPDAEEV